MKKDYSWRYWLAPRFAQESYTAWEWGIMRILFAYFALIPATPLALNFQEQPKPTGIAQFIDLTWLCASPYQQIVTVLFYAFLALYVVNYLPLTATAGLLVIHTLEGTLVNSQRAPHHTSQIVGFILIGQLLAHLYSHYQHRREPLAKRPPTSPSSLVYLSLQLAAAAYVVAGLSKLLKSGLDWVAQIPNIPLQFEKNFDMHYYDHLVETPRDTAHGMIQFISENPGMAKFLFGSGLVLELFAFLALWNRLTLALFGISLWFLHDIISSVMNLGFMYNKAALLIFFVNLPWWLWVCFDLYRRRQNTSITS